MVVLKVSLCQRSEDLIKSYNIQADDFTAFVWKKTIVFYVLLNYIDILVDSAFFIRTNYNTHVHGLSCTGFSICFTFDI